MAPAAELRQRKPEVANTNGTKVSKPKAPAVNAQELGPFAARCKTLCAILYLWAFSPLLVLLAVATWVRNKIFGTGFPKVAKDKQLRILVTGGKMSKASAVARAVGRDGHKVFTAEISPYEFCHTRFCKYVSKHYVLPRPTVQPKEWVEKMQAIVTEQNIDLIIPCTAPIESTCYAHLREKLPKHVRVFAFDGATSDELDNKYTFNQVLVKAGLACPETGNMECLEDALEFFKDRPAEDGGKKFIVKPAVYDPKARTEILFLPIADKNRQLEYLKSRNATKAVPYVIQEVLENPEYGSYAIYNEGELTAFELFESAASCLVYRQLQGKHYDQVMELHKGLGKAMNLTGQLTWCQLSATLGSTVPSAHWRATKTLVPSSQMP